jgi:hypothetical protein
MILSSQSTIVALASCKSGDLPTTRLVLEIGTLASHVAASTLQEMTCCLADTTLPFNGVPLQTRKLPKDRTRAEFDNQSQSTLLGGGMPKPGCEYYCIAIALIMTERNVRVIGVQ